MKLPPSVAENSRADGEGEGRVSVLSHTVGVCKRCAIELILNRASMEDPWLCDRCIYHEYSALRAALAAANTRAEEAERKLCAAREQLKVACKWLAGSEWGTIEFERAMHEINAVEAFPCRHAAEADAMREAIDEAERAYPTDIFSEPGPDDFYHLRTGPRGISERLHGSWARHLVKIIRDNAARVSGGEGGVE